MASPARLASRFRRCGDEKIVARALRLLLRICTKYNDGDDEGGCGGGGGTRGLESMSPIPSQAVPGIPVPETDDIAQDLSGSISLLAHDVSGWIGFAVVVYCNVMFFARDLNKESGRVFVREVCHVFAVCDHA